MAEAMPTKNQLQAEIRQLRKEAHRLRDFSELSADWFWEQDENLRFVGFSGISTEKLRRRQRDFIGHLRWEMKIHGVTEEELAAHIACCENHQPFRDFEYDICSDEGEDQRYSISGTPIFDEQGEFRGYHGVGRNITPLYRAQLAVKASELKLSQILMGSPVPIFVLDADHRVSHWNQACENLTGIPASEMVGRREGWKGFYSKPRPTLADLVVDRADSDRIENYYWHKFSESEVIAGAYQAEDYFPHMKEGGRWLYFTAAPLLDDDGNTVGAIETLQDITLRRQAEEAEQKSLIQLQKAHAELQTTMGQLVEAKKLAGLGRLVAGVAHELNTPVGNARMSNSTMQGMVEKMQEAFDNNTLSRSLFAEFLSEANQALTLMHQNIERSSHLVTRFRELAEDQRHTEVVRFSPREIAGNVQQFRHKELAEKVANFIVDIDQELF
ncbi:MAG: PAS domain-containing protein, partial [Motiliproteus sp.]|nr:PAS domain-containing protein [Motiliproteus sp.]